MAHCGIGNRNNDGMLPMHRAAEWGHKDVVEFLLANKAEVNAKGFDPDSHKGIDGNFRIGPFQFETDIRLLSRNSLLGNEGILPADTGNFPAA
jgi:ankyrin repeat protein